MKQIVCEKPYHFSMIEVKEPEPTDGEALVKIKRIGICGTDFHAYCGRQPYFSRIQESEAGRPGHSHSLFGMRELCRLPKRQAQLLHES
mgnify:CR=1 FL=1